MSAALQQCTYTAPTFDVCCWRHERIKQRVPCASPGAKHTAAALCVLKHGAANSENTSLIRTIRGLHAVGVEYNGIETPDSPGPVHRGFSPNIASTV
ncbi:unnamed protein product [Gadus morhua 'NCC']